MILDDTVRRLVDGRNFAVVATVRPDGAPQSSVIWVARDNDTVVFSTTAVSAKAQNLEAEPRVSLSVFDLENPYRSVEIRGTAQLVDDTGKRLVQELSHKYLGTDFPPDPPDVRRVVVRIRPDRVIHFAA